MNKSKTQKCIQADGFLKKKNWLGEDRLLFRQTQVVAAPRKEIACEHD